MHVPEGLEQLGLEEFVAVQVVVIAIVAVVVAVVRVVDSTTLLLDLEVDLWRRDSVHSKNKAKSNNIRGKFIQQ